MQSPTFHINNKPKTQSNLKICLYPDLEDLQEKQNVILNPDICINLG